MNEMTRRAVLTAGGVAALAAAGLADATDRTPRWSTIPSRDALRRRHFPDIVLRTHENREVRLYEDLIKDKFVTFNFMYTNCESTCPLTTHNLVRVQKLLKDRVGRDLFMYSITLDPENDSPEALARYAKRHGAGPGWIFLRAEPGDTPTLRRKLGFYDRNPEVDGKWSTHTAMVRFGNEPRQLWAATSGLVAPDAIARAILWVDWPERKTAQTLGCCS